MIRLLSRASAVFASSLLALAAAACGTRPDAKRIEPVYDKTTGRLQVLKYDSDGDGKIDTVSYMDGASVLRIEIDSDEDGKVDRWEYYGPDQKLEKVGFSRANDGKVDAWSYVGPDGSVVKVDVSTRRDGTVDRVEHYEHGKLASTDEDTDGDGMFDKWATYDGDRLASVAFDTEHTGAPDRRLVYGADGSARLELNKDGRFLPVESGKTPQGRGSRAVRP